MNKKRQNNFKNNHLDYKSLKLNLKKDKISENNNEND